MTREEAIEQLQDAKIGYKEYLSNDVLDIAILALEHPEKNVVAVVPCGDTVSRQAVIDLMMQKWGENFSGDDAMQESIDAIRVMPSVTPLSSGLEKNSQKLEKDFGELDCISRADAIRIASGYCHPSNVTKELAKLPSVTPQEPKTGHWKDIPKYKDIAWQCSECEHFTTMKHNFCPNCGCRMIEPQESEG